MDTPPTEASLVNGKPFEQEWGTFLNEVRTTLPGVQLLFGFLMAVPFTARFVEMVHYRREAFFVCFLLTTAACAFLMAPSMYHRLHWRREVADKERMFLTCNRLAIVGGVLLAGAMSSAVFVISLFMVDIVSSVVVTSIAAGLFFLLWFWLPLARRQRALRTRTEAEPPSV